MTRLYDFFFFFFFSSPAWAALWLPLCRYPSHLFLKITLELVIIFVPAHDRTNIKITHPADSHWITRLSKPEVRSSTKEEPGFCFPSDTDGSSWMKPLALDSSDLSDIWWITCWKEHICTSSFPRASLQRRQHNICLTPYIAHVFLISWYHWGLVGASKTFRKQ